MRKSPLELNRHKFEIEVQKKAIKVEELLAKVKKGEINKNELCFTLDAFLQVCDRVAIGMFYNTRRLENPKGKWAKEAMRKQVTEIITNAFT